MFEKINNQKFTILPKPPKENEALCSHCGGNGWMIDKERGILENCGHCHNGIIRLCERCGNPLNSYGQCKTKKCIELKEQKRLIKKSINEQMRVDKAKHYTFDTVPKESMIVLFSDSYRYNEGYFNDIDEFKDYYYSEEDEMPNYVWGTKAVPFTLNAYDIVSNALEDSFEDAFDRVDEDELQKLQNAIDKFCKYHSDSLTTYYVDYNVCIDL